MQDQTQIFLFLSPDIEELLVENQIDLVEFLQQEGIEADQVIAKDPTTDAKSGHRDVTTVILASAALVLAITPIISKLIAALCHKKVVVKELICLPVEDSGRNVVRDSFGEPILQWVERARFLESSEKMRSDTQISLKGPVGLEVTYGDSPTKTLPYSDSSER
ncbi:hypothetical protein [Nostoc sp.]|uniref:hypothetical protein n=1 Tax=Nostoc sp. TaxID=1180 RepID=UPI002FF1541F